MSAIDQHVCEREEGVKGGSHGLIRRLADLLASELVHPLRRLVVGAAVAGEAWDYERHD